MIADRVDVTIDRLVVDGLDPAAVEALGPLITEELRRLVATGATLGTRSANGRATRDPSADEAADPRAIARAIAGQIAASLPGGPT